MKNYIIKYSFEFIVIFLGILISLYFEQSRQDRIENERKNKSGEDLKNNDLDIKFIDINQKTVEKSIEGQVLDDMGLHKYCCRVPFLTNVHLITEL